jgi:predicted aconitase
MAYRLMVAHERMGSVPSWTCAPYQAGAQLSLGQQVARGESNAVAFTNTVLGARTNRYGDCLEIACAISARAPYYGLHKPENRHAKLVLDGAGLSPHPLKQSAFYPVLGSIIGRLAGETVCAVTWLSQGATDDELNALRAGAASTGAVALTHIVGVTPEAPDLATALGGQPSRRNRHSHSRHDHQGTQSVEPGQIRPHHALNMRPPVPEILLEKRQFSGTERGG